MDELGNRQMHGWMGLWPMDEWIGTTLWNSGLQNKCTPHREFCWKMIVNCIIRGYSVFVYIVTSSYWANSLCAIYIWDVNASLLMTYWCYLEKWCQWYPYNKRQKANAKGLSLREIVTMVAAFNRLQGNKELCLLEKKSNTRGVE